MENLNAEKLWSTALSHLELEMPKANFETWLKNTTALSLNQQSLVISTISPFAVEMLSKRLMPTISRVVDNIANLSISIDFKVSIKDEKKSNINTSKTKIKRLEKKYFTVIFENDSEAKFFCDYMLNNGIILRHLKGFGLKECVRITTGNNDETNVLIQNIEKYYS